MKTFRSAALVGALSTFGIWQLAAQFPGQQYPGQTGGQYPPGQYPPGQGPGGQYPGGQTPGGQRQPQQSPYPGGRTSGDRTPPATADRSGKAYGTTTTRGLLRVVNRNQLILEAEDHRIVWYQFDDGIQVVDGKGAASSLDTFIPGDHLSVDSTEDDAGLFYAEAVHWVSVGLPEERAEARRTWDLPDKIPSPEAAKRQTDASGRPRLTRDGVTSNAKSGSTDSESSSEDRPKFTRPGGSSNPAASAPSNEPKSTATDSSASSDDRPKFSRPGTVAAPPVTPTQPASTAQTPAAQNEAKDSENETAEATAPVTPDTPLPDSARADRPVLTRRVSRAPSAPDELPTLRGATPTASTGKSTPVQVATNIPANAPTSAPVPTIDKPVLTQATGASTDMIAARSTAVPQDDATIAKARQAVEEFVQSLPNFVTHQNTTRYIKDDARAQWRAQDLVTASLTYREGQEVYSDVRVGKNKVQGALKDIEGFRTTGEFGAVLEEIFDPGTATLFSRSGADEIHGRRAIRYKFTVARDHSRWRISSPSQLFYAGYQGTLWIDPDTGRIMRLEQQAAGLPKPFPFDTVEMSIDYDFVRLDVGKTFLLPTESEALDCIRSTSVCMRNQTSFRNYTKFDADSRLIFTDDTK
ncbi:MAG: hypothetical protein ABI824_02660 [Acidobacteriota bacterium]